MHPAYLRGKHAIIHEGIHLASSMLENGINKFSNFTLQGISTDQPGGIINNDNITGDNINYTTFDDLNSDYVYDDDSVDEDI